MKPRSFELMDFAREQTRKYRKPSAIPQNEKDESIKKLKSAYKIKQIGDSCQLLLATRCAYEQFNY